LGTINTCGNKIWFFELACWLGIFAVRRRAARFPPQFKMHVIGNFYHLYLLHAFQHHIDDDDDDDVVQLWLNHNIKPLFANAIIIAL
jgi:hypothetical protein